jgi:arylsulfatase
VFLLDPHFPDLADQENYSQSRWRNYEANLRLYLEDQDTPYSSRVHEQLVTAYDDSVRYTDEFLHVVNRSVGDDTRIVVTADHGEAFGEHGTYGHHDELFEENIRVPLVVSGGPTGTERTPVSLRHLPQLVTGLATDDGNGIRSLGQEVVGSKTEGGSRAVARGRDWKYVEGFERGSFYHVTGTHEKRVDDSELGTLGERALETWRRRTGSSDVLADVVDGSLFDGRPLGATL